MFVAMVVVAAVVVGAALADALVAAGGGAVCPHEGVAVRLSKTVPTAQTRMTRDPDPITCRR